MSRLMSIGAMGRVDARRLLAGLVLVMLAGLTMSGCTKSEPVKASGWAMPDVVWDAGAAPSGGAEDSPWAKEFRSYNLKTAYVWATVDTSYPEYVALVGYDEAVSVGESFGTSGGNLAYYDADNEEYLPEAPARWDAQRLLVTKVAEDASGGSAVVSYVFVKYSSTFSEIVRAADVRVMRSDDGTVLVEADWPGASPEDPEALALAEAVAIGDIPTARWATPITKPTLPGEVKMPLPREYYVELGVIE